MQVGLVSPIVTANPGAHSAWESHAGAAELKRIARAADDLGFHHLTCSEHVGVPAQLASERGGTYWDPLATLSYLAAVTERIALATQVLVLGYHHPLQIAKSYGTLDLVSGGRLVLGLGVGSLREEFELIDATFEGRGAIADDALQALRAAWGQSRPQHAGPHFSFEDFVIEPHSPRTEVPMWIGGRTPRSLRRATSLGTGWVPFGLGLDDLSRMLSETELPPGFEVVLSPGRPVDPGAEPERTADRLRRVREAGATIISTSVSAESADHYCEQLEALAGLAEVRTRTTDLGTHGVRS